MSLILDKIVADKRAAHLRRTAVDLDLLRKECAELDKPRSLAAALRDPSRKRPRAIAEFKRKSPSAGAIRPSARPEEIVRQYEAHGASALSILTDQNFFDGHIDH